MGRGVTKLPLELETQLKEITDVLTRRKWRKRLRNTLGCIALYEGWIEEAKQPFTHNEEPSEWFGDGLRSIHEHRIKSLPEYEEKLEKTRQQSHEEVEVLKQFIMRQNDDDYLKNNPIWFL